MSARTVLASPDSRLPARSPRHQRRVRAQAGHPGAVPRDRTRQDHRAGRPERLRQVDAVEVGRAAASGGGRPVLLEGQDIHALPTREVAQRLGILPQSPIAPESITVGDLVWRGRHPHRRFGQRRTAADDEVIADALTATGTAELIDRPVDQLSGGQRQRVWIALALAQDTPTLLLDEPTTYLDIAHQIEVMDLLADLNEQAYKTIVLVSHDLNQAALYASTIVAMRDGRIVRRGTPEEVLTEQTVAEVFGLECLVVPHPRSGRPQIFPLGRRTLA